MIRFKIFLGALVLFLVSSCTSNEIGSSKDVNPDAIWFDYKVWGEEGNEDMTVMLQYRFAGENGTTLQLENPSKVELDGELIKGDSSKMTGAFYEIRKPVKEFAGKHTIIFTDQNKKKYKEEFSFRPISLKTAIPEIIERDNLVFELAGLNPVDYVRVILNDTLFGNNGIHRIDTVRNGRIVISKTDLENLVNGPIQLELYKEDERQVRNGTREGGHISFTYGLKREFSLKDNPVKE